MSSIKILSAAEADIRTDLIRRIGICNNYGSVLSRINLNFAVCVCRCAGMVAASVFRRFVINRNVYFLNRNGCAGGNIFNIDRLPVTKLAGHDAVFVRGKGGQIRIVVIFQAERLVGNRVADRIDEGNLKLEFIILRERFAAEGVFHFLRNIQSAGQDRSVGHDALNDRTGDRHGGAGIGEFILSMICFGYGKIRTAGNAQNHGTLVRRKRKGNENLPAVGRNRIFICRKRISVRVGNNDLSDVLRVHI